MASQFDACLYSCFKTHLYGTLNLWTLQNLHGVLGTWDPRPLVLDFGVDENDKTTEKKTPGRSL
jgi:hypothetical protein